MKSKLDFRSEKQARDHAIALRKIWIDRGKKNTRRADTMTREEIEGEWANSRRTLGSGPFNFKVLSHKNLI